MKIWQCFDNLPAQDWFYTDDKRIALTNQGTTVHLFPFTGSDMVFKVSASISQMVTSPTPIRYRPGNVPTTISIRLGSLAIDIWIWMRFLLPQIWTRIAEQVSSKAMDSCIVNISWLICGTRRIFLQL